MSDFAAKTQKKAFGIYLMCRALVTIAIHIQAISLSWILYSLTGDPLDLGLLGLFQFTPILLFSIPAGNLADRKDRETIIRFCFGAFALIAIAFTYLTHMNQLSRTHIYLLIGLVGVTRAFMGPAAQAFFPQMIARKEFSKAVAQNSTVWQTATIIGPSLGGLLYARLPSATAVFFCGVVLFVLAFLLFLNIQVSASRKVISHKNALQDVREGIQFLLKTKPLLGAISLDLFAVLFGGITALLPVYAKDILHVGPEGLGYLRSAPAIGATLGALFMSRYPIKKHIGRRMFQAVLAFGFFTLVFSLSHTFLLSLIALALIGASDIISVVTRGTLVQILTPDGMRGRISAINGIFIGASNELGEFESGLTAKWFGTVPAAFLGGILTIAIGLSWMSLFPALKKLDRID